MVACRGENRINEFPFWRIVMAYKIKKKNTLSHIIVEARAGTGKTSTMIAGLNLMFGDKPKFNPTAEQLAIWDAMSEGDRPDKIIFVAFNKSIQIELQEKVPSGVEAKTLHGLGYSILAKNGYKIQASADAARYLVRDMLGYEKGASMSKEDYRDSMVVEKMVGILKNNLIGWSDEELEMVINENDVDVNGNKAQVFNLVKQVMDKSSKLTRGKMNWISFDDMIWLPNVMELKQDKFDLMIVDECQDLNCAQQQMVLKLAERLILIGDSHQSIYGFRGADVKSMERMSEHLGSTKVGVKHLSLTTTWRCPKLHVQNVNKYVADIKAADSAIDGIIANYSKNDMVKRAKAGDMIVSRVNANLCQAAFRLIRAGKPCRILGRDYGANLINLVKKLDTDDKLSTLRGLLADWRAEEEARINKAYTFPAKQLELLGEKYNSLVHLTGGLTKTSELIERIDSLFSSKLTSGQSITLSTVHKAKGLESDVVWILGREKMPHPMAKKDWERQQEINLIYVAETRSKDLLAYVNDDMDDEPETGFAN
jgi:superfamily I DNA/RNA helicase